MGFTLQDAKELAESFLPGNKIQGEDVLIWGNLFISNEIGSAAWLQVDDDEMCAGMTSDTGVYLPEEFISMVGMLDSNGERYERYKIQKRQVFVRDDGSYTITYISHPDKLTDLRTFVDLHDIFLEALAYYLAYKFAAKKPADNAMVLLAQQCKSDYKTSLKEAFDELELDSENESFKPGPNW